MLFRLAGHLKWPNVAWGAARMTSMELAEWEVFAELEPFGPAREDLRAGVIASMLGAKGATAEKFFPNLRRLRRDNTLEEDLAALHSLTPKGK